MWLPGLALLRRDAGCLLRDLVKEQDDDRYPGSSDQEHETNSGHVQHDLPVHLDHCFTQHLKVAYYLAGDIQLSV